MAPWFQTPVVLYAGTRFNSGKDKEGEGGRGRGGKDAHSEGAEPVIDDQSDAKLWAHAQYPCHSSTEKSRPALLPQHLLQTVPRILVYGPTLHRLHLNQNTHNTHKVPINTCSE
eukprot:TRINITY_DN16252_c0_g1_i2.p1 TRINITY_DN16252_c0_g1~~TRINITY_DN16252_c0_g1_i2.p1  ORF type:complete len:114 (-),score=20.93 TRINITY_DN16252_c0_g1_i2:22-363(-)